MAENKSKNNASKSGGNKQEETKVTTPTNSSNSPAQKDFASTNKPNRFASSMGQRPDDANELALQAAAEAGRAEVKPSAPAKAKKEKKADDDVIDESMFPASSRALAKLLRERVGSDRNVSATSAENTVEVSTDVALFLQTDLELTISQKEAKNPVFLKVGERARRTIIRLFSMTLQELDAELPEREKTTRASNQLFPYSWETVTRSIARYAPIPEAGIQITNRIDWMEIARGGGSISINGIEFPINVSTAIQEYPERFTPEGQYKPVRNVKSESGTGTTPERKVFVLKVGYDDGSENGIAMLYRDYGTKNFGNKLNSRQQYPVKALTGLETLIVKGEDADADEAEDEVENEATPVTAETVATVEAVNAEVVAAAQDTGTTTVVPASELPANSAVAVPATE